MDKDRILYFTWLILAGEIFLSIFYMAIGSAMELQSTKLIGIIFMFLIVIYTIILIRKYPPFIKEKPSLAVKLDSDSKDVIIESSRISIYAGIMLIILAAYILALPFLMDRPSRYIPIAILGAFLGAMFSILMKINLSFWKVLREKNVLESMPGNNAKKLIGIFLFASIIIAYPLTLLFLYSISYKFFMVGMFYMFLGLGLMMIIPSIINIKVLKE